MNTALLCASLLVAGTGTNSALAAHPSKAGLASWYGEDHRGKLMANGKPFDPDKLTAASWFYPLGTTVRVTAKSQNRRRSVLVTITDRGPSFDLVRDGRIIDLGRAAFKRIAHPDLGLVVVTVHPVSRPGGQKVTLASR
jgi:rare lipoprotein A